MPAQTQSRTGALYVIAACFVASAALRGPRVLAALPAVAADLSAAMPRTGLLVDPGVAEGSRLHAELERQRSTLDARAKALDARQAALDDLGKRMEARLAELRQARDALAAATAGVKDSARDDVRHLADTYARMKPRDAGRLFDAMAPSFAAGFLGEMKPDIAAGILAGMDAGKAYAVSLELAGRNLPRPGPAAGGPAIAQH